MSGTLYVVATPIGNLEDITLRALRVLREVALIAAEDTRRTANLLAHHSIRTRTVSFHEHNTRVRLPRLIHRLEAGDSMALVSDAGTPGVSDPGLELVQACVERGIPVDPVPGVSAPLTALMGSGFPIVPFTMYGFVPNRSNARTKWFSDVAQTPHTFSFFEAPHRVKGTLLEAQQYLGDRQIVAARELTKLHQEFMRGTAIDVAERISVPRGEYTVVVSPNYALPLAPGVAVTDVELAQLFCQIANNEPVTRRGAVSRVASTYGISSRRVYAAIERAKKLGV